MDSCWLVKALLYERDKHSLLKVFSSSILAYHFFVSLLCLFCFCVSCLARARQTHQGCGFFWVFASVATTVVGRVIARETLNDQRCL